MVKINKTNRVLLLVLSIVLLILAIVIGCSAQPTSPFDNRESIFSSNNDSMRKELWMLRVSLEDFNRIYRQEIQNLIHENEIDGRVEDLDELLRQIREKFGVIVDVYTYEEAVLRFGQEAVNRAIDTGTITTCCNAHCSPACFDRCKPCWLIIVGPGETLGEQQRKFRHDDNTKELWIFNVTNEEFYSYYSEVLSRLIEEDKKNGRLNTERVLLRIISQYGDIIEVISYEEALRRYGKEAVDRFLAAARPETCCNDHCSDDCFDVCKPCRIILPGPVAMLPHRPHYSRISSTVSIPVTIEGSMRNIEITLFDGYTLTDEIIKNIQAIYSIEGISDDVRDKMIRSEIRKLRL